MLSRVQPLKRYSLVRGSRVTRASTLKDSVYLWRVEGGGGVSLIESILGNNSFIFKT